MSDKVSRRDTTNYQKLMNCIKIQLCWCQKNIYKASLRSKSLNLSLNMMIHQIKASNYLMAPWITTVFAGSLIWKMALSYFFLMLFMKSPKEMNDDDLVGKKFLLACHSKNSIHFCCQRNSIKRRESKHQNRTISISKVGKLSSLYKNFFLILLWCNSKVIRFFHLIDGALGFSSSSIWKKRRTCCNLAMMNYWISKEIVIFCASWMKCTYILMILMEYL